MRCTRFNKFKSKNLTFMIVLKIAVVWYLVIFSASYLTSNTAANFTANKEAGGMMTLGTWKVQDDSVLVFTGKGNQNIKACDQPIVMKVNLKNTGGDMKSDSTYEIYYIENGNPEKHGTKVELAKGEGTIKALKSGETTELTHKTSKLGTYVFLAKQQNDNPDMKDAWSKWIKFHCPDNKPETKEKVETEKPKDKVEKDKKKSEDKEQQKPEVTEDVKKDSAVKEEKQEPKEEKKPVKTETEKQEKNEPTNKVEKESEETAKKEKPANKNATETEDAGNNEGDEGN